MSRKSSQKRIEANRRNAQKSTGPRSPEGKTRSAQNATTHGHASHRFNPLQSGCLLRMEEKSEFEGILQDYIGTYHPQHRDELDLLTEAVFAKWKQQRLWLAETSQIEVAMALHERDLQEVLPNANSGAHLANAIAKSEQILKLYLRYDAQYHRHYYNCLKRLKELQDGRVPPAPQPAPPPNEPKPPAAETAPAPPPNEPKLTPEQARLQFMKAEIKRFDDHQAALLGRQKAFADPAN